MSTPVKPTASAPRTPLSATARSTQQKQPVKQEFLFEKENYMWMLGGLALILLAFVLMAGGKSENPAEFHYEEIYSFRRITLAPIILLLGFAVEAYAIMKKPKDTTTPNGVTE